MRASIILSVYNRKDLIGLCLESLLKQSLPDYEIIIIDDGSTDGTKELLDAYAGRERIVLIYNNKNSGVSVARNRGIEKSRGEYLCFTDSDCIADSSWLQELIAPFEKDPMIMATGGSVQDPPAMTYWEVVGKGENFIKNTSGYVPRVTGCNMAFRRDFLIRFPFDEALRASEDMESCLICERLKYKVFYTDSAKVIHYRRKTFDTTFKQQFNWGYYNAVVYLKHGQFPFISYGSWILTGIVLFAVTGGVLSNRFWQSAGIFLTVMYLGLAFCLNAHRRQGRLGEIVISFPGFLIRCLADSLGNLCSLLSRITCLRPVALSSAPHKHQYNPPQR